MEDDSPEDPAPRQRRFPWLTWCAAGVGASLWLCFFRILPSPLAGHGDSEILYFLWAVAGMMATFVAAVVDAGSTHRVPRVIGLLLAVLLNGAPIVLAILFLLMIAGYRPAPGG